MTREAGPVGATTLGSGAAAASPLAVGGDHAVGLAFLGLGGAALLAGVPLAVLAPGAFAGTLAAAGVLLALFGVAVLLAPEAGRVTVGSAGVAAGGAALLANVFAPGALPVLAAAAGLGLVLVQVAVSAGRLVVWRLGRGDPRLQSEGDFVGEDVKADLSATNRWLQNVRPRRPEGMRSVTLAVNDEWEGPLGGNFSAIGSRSVMLPGTPEALQLRGVRSGERVAHTSGVAAEADALRAAKSPDAKRARPRLRIRE